MTLADMSVITAEVKVDETDIVNVALGQPAQITVDALPNRVFSGKVTLVGDQALLRSTGVATSQSTTGTEEAKDFKVIVTLDPNQPNLNELRPGFSTTAKITTARKSNILTLPIQALVNRVPGKLDTSGKPVPDAPGAKTPDPVQGVFVVRSFNGKLRAVFTPVTTGITGATDMEVVSGLTEGEEIVTGPFTTLRTLKNGALLKRDNTKPTSGS
jgi:HlyD family secretion protein